MTAEGFPVKRLEPRIASGLTKIVASGVTNRGPSVLCGDDMWQDAVELIESSGSVAVVTGFFVPGAGEPETDGPPGAVVLARAISRTGRDVEVWTDGHCLDCVSACAGALDFPKDSVRDVSGSDGGIPELLVYVERLGRASDGRYYNMRMEDITDWTAPLDRFAMMENARVLAVGDGGNEVGMALLSEPLSRIMPGYSNCLCSVKADVCLPVDVSNWGAFAVAAAISCLRGKWLGQTGEEDVAMFEALHRCGAVDGVTKKNELSVDGLPMEVHLKIRDELEALLELR